MTLEEALSVAERLEQEDCIGTTSLALRTLYKAFKRLEIDCDHRVDHAYGEGYHEGLKGN